MWKYFVETDLHKKEYEKYYDATNCVTTGSIKLDGYHFINKDNAENYWKTKDKKRIIYAPHHSFNDGLHEVATFKANGQFILELAKTHPETEWIFRPHPLFIDRITKNSIMTLEEVKKYYKEWEEIGSISIGGNYYEMFSSSDLLITDCISFLTEYAPTGKPVIHLRKNNQKEDFNTLVSKLDEGYYQIYSNEELKEVFEKLIVNNEDYLKEKRENNKKLLPVDILASEKIYHYLKKTLWI
jgi:CDP-glycerol glycerophosphotransferase (TagB/SpsB family)